MASRLIDRNAIPIYWFTEREEVGGMNRTVWIGVVVVFLLIVVAVGVGADGLSRDRERDCAGGGLRTADGGVAGPPGVDRDGHSSVRGVYLGADTPVADRGVETGDIAPYLFSRINETFV
jgi:hypothetical protein